MTLEHIRQRLELMGVKKPFKPYYEPETEKIGLKTRKPPQFIDGAMRGCEIILEGKVFRVWTSQVQKARRLADGLRIRYWDREAEVWVPADRADELLPQFGARVKMQYSPEVLAKKRAIALAMRQNLDKKAPLGA